MPDSARTGEEVLERNHGLIELIGADRVLLASNYPHPEGVADPRSFLEGHGLSEKETRLISRENTARLLAL